MTQIPQLRDLPWKVKLMTAGLCFAIDTTRRSDGTVNRFLMNFFDLKSSPSKKPINGVTSTDITVNKARDLWFRLYTPTPSGDATMPVVFYFHGGGFAYLSANSKAIDAMCCELSRQLSAVVVSVNYRLAPEQRYPAQVEDCFSAIKFIDEGIEGLPSQVNLKHCFLAGDSAGGNLVHHVLIEASKHEFRSVKLIGAALIQPFFGGEERTESEEELNGKVPFITKERTDWMWKAFLSVGSDRNHPAANVLGKDSDDISGLKFPASVIFVGEFDPLKDRQKKYCERLKMFGKNAQVIEYETFHAFYIHPQLPEFSRLINDFKDFVKTQIEAENN